MSLEFKRLNIDWSPQPNVPEPEVLVDGATLSLRILITAPRRAGDESEAMELTFSACRAWRLGGTNDEGWYRGQCRYGKLAPQWGQFYEIIGEDPIRDQPADWQPVEHAGDGTRHYLIYLRDETFECVADGWTLTPIKARARVSNSNDGLIGISGVEYLA